MQPRNTGNSTARAAIVASTLLLAGCAAPEQRFAFSEPLMGTTFRIVVEGDDPAAAERAAQAAFERVRALNAVMSDWDPGSELSRLPAAPAGRPVPASRDLVTVLMMAQDMARRSGGAFDVTVGPLVKLWRRARRLATLPARERLVKARAAVGWRLLQVDRGAGAVTLKVPGMRLDLGGIGKGFAAQEALRVLAASGFERALVDAGGDVSLGDPPRDGAGWRVGLPPLDQDGQPTLYLEAARCSVATSGATFRFALIDGVRYSHIVDPRTGMALHEGLTVTAIAPDGALADALASAASVLGPGPALGLAASLPGAGLRILRPGPDGPRVHQSPGFPAVTPARRDGSPPAR